jgi:hypothetical protein
MVELVMRLGRHCNLVVNGHTPCRFLGHPRGGSRSESVPSANAPFGGRLVNDEGVAARPKLLRQTLTPCEPVANIVNHSATMDCNECLRKYRLLLLVASLFYVSLALLRQKFSLLRDILAA